MDIEYRLVSLDLVTAFFTSYLMCVAPMCWTETGEFPILRNRGAILPFGRTENESAESHSLQYESEELEHSSVSGFPITKPKNESATLRFVHVGQYQCGFYFVESAIQLHVRNKINEQHRCCAANRNDSLTCSVEDTQVCSACSRAPLWREAKISGSGYDRSHADRKCVVDQHIAHCSSLHMPHVVTWDWITNKSANQ